MLYRIIVFIDHQPNQGDIEYTDLFTPLLGPSGRPGILDEYNMANQSRFTILTEQIVPVERGQPIHYNDGVNDLFSRAAGQRNWRHSQPLNITTLFSTEAGFDTLITTNDLRMMIVLENDTAVNLTASSNTGFAVMHARCYFNT